MAWIESHTELAEHYKTKKLMRLLGISLPEAIGHLHLLWWWAFIYASPEGSLAGFGPEEIADAAQWKGDPQAFLDALLSCGKGNDAGFVERDAHGEPVLHDWWDYVGRYMEKKWANAERARAWRARKRDERITNDANVPTIPNQPANQPELHSVDKPRRPFTSKKQEAMFDRWYSGYPKRRKKGDAERAWSKIKPDEALLERMEAAVVQAKQTYDWLKEDGKYIPYPASWLNAKGWEDEFKPTTGGDVQCKTDERLRDLFEEHQIPER